MSKTKTTTIQQYTKKNGEKRFMFKVYLGVNPLTGKPQYTTRRGFKKIKEAEQILARIKLAVSEGTFQKERAETFNDVYDLWIKQYGKTVQESTFVKTTSIFRNHILPAIGNYKISKININVCQECVDVCKLKNTRNVKTYASKVFDFAIKREYIQKNPFALVEITNKSNTNQYEDDEENDDKPENFYNREELINFLQCAKKDLDFKLYTFFQLLAWSGIRKGEALALTWKDIDFETNEIRIVKALSKGVENRLYLKPPKNGKNRIVDMDPTTMSILKKWKIQQRQYLHLLGHNTMQQTQLVFSNRNNNFIQPSSTNTWLKRVLTKNHLPYITTHGFRHTHCSLLFEAGCEKLVIKDRLGHKDFKTTLNVYAHVTKKAKDNAVNKLEKFMAMEFEQNKE